MFQFLNRCRDYVCRRMLRARPSLKANKGQTAIVLILIIAIALVIYGISLNWSRITQYKTMTTIGANTAAANMAALIASYGEQVLQTTLDGKPKYCGRTNFVVMLIVVIIVIIVVIVTWGTTFYLLAVVIAVIAIMIAVAALVINLVVIQPGLTRLWNRMQDKIQTMEDRTVEGALLAGLQSVVTDTVTVEDNHDMDTDGLWMNKFSVSNTRLSTGMPMPNDMISRFGFYYTKRMQSLEAIQVPEIDFFLKELNELIYDNPFDKIGPNYVGCTTCVGVANCTPNCCADVSNGDITCQSPDNFGIFDPVCTPDSKDPSPYCNRCCEVKLDELGLPEYPKGCEAEDIADCGSGDYPNPPYTSQYDPYFEDFCNGFQSLREQLGVDDENKYYKRNPAEPDEPPAQTAEALADIGFHAKDATGYYPPVVQKRRGVFPFFWNMAGLTPAVPPVPPLGIGVLPKSDNALIISTTNVTIGTTTTTINKFVTPEDKCALSEYASDPASPKGFWWKSGSDVYCSTTYPYDDCSSKSGVCPSGSFDGTNYPQCGCTKSLTKSEWREDVEDNFVYGLKQFTHWADFILSKEIDVIYNTLPGWYKSATEWIGPKCQSAWNCNGPVASRDVQCLTCRKGESDGQLIGWHKMLKDWGTQMDQWMYTQSFVDPTAWCLKSSDISTLPMAEQNAIIKSRTDAAAPIQACLASVCAVNGTVVPECRAFVPSATECTYQGFGPSIGWAVGNPRYDELNARILTTQPYGNLSDTVACLNYNQNNVTKFTACKTPCTNNAITPPPSTVVDACLDLPRSVVGDMSMGNVNYISAQKLQNCLNSLSSLSSCTTATSPGGACTSLPAGSPVVTGTTCSSSVTVTNFYNAAKVVRDNYFNLSDFCEAGPTKVAFLSNLDNSIAGATAQNLAPRAQYLTKLFAETKAAREIFFVAYRKFDDFLKPCAPGLALGAGCSATEPYCPNGGPVAQLLCARQNFEKDTESKRLPNFVIYGWQSEPVKGRAMDQSNPDQPTGYWHIVRVETFVPKRCFNQCLTNQFPDVDSSTEWRFGPQGTDIVSVLNTPFGVDQYRCYELDNTRGRVIARVTRYDEDHDTPLSRFANGQTIWRSRTSNPAMGQANTTGLATDCVNDALLQDHYGPGTATSDLAKAKLRAAFMINGVPENVNARFRRDEHYSETCWIRVNELLDRGVSTTTCAEYYLDESVKHMSLKFVKCPEDAVQHAVDCASGKKDQGLCR